MGYVTIDYKSLEDASEEAEAVSRKLEDYAKRYIGKYIKS